MQGRSHVMKYPHGAVESLTSYKELRMIHVASSLSTITACLSASVFSLAAEQPCCCLAVPVYVCFLRELFIAATPPPVTTGMTYDVCAKNIPIYPSKDQKVLQPPHRLPPYILPHWFSPFYRNLGATEGLFFSRSPG